MREGGVNAHRVGKVASRQSVQSAARKRCSDDGRVAAGNSLDAHAALHGAAAA
jgi:hypothetical protein